MTIHHTSRVDPYDSRRTVIGSPDVAPIRSTFASGGQVLTFTGSPEQERAIRRHERALIGTLLTAAISEKQNVSLQHALRKLDPEAARACGTVIHLLTSLLGEQAEEQAA